MLNNKMQTYDHYTYTSTKDGYGQVSLGYALNGTVDAIIMYKSTTTTSTNPKYSECTHIGLTPCKTIQLKDKIDSYVVIEVNNQGKLAQLLLVKGG